MRRSAIALAALALAGCFGPTWPDGQFPAELEVKRTLFAGGGGGFRETCMAMVVELTGEAAAGVVKVKRAGDGLALVPPVGWNNTPLREAISAHTFYEGAFGGCDKGVGSPLGDLPGALTRPGAYYKILNGGEGIAIIVPRAKLAGLFYFG